MIFKANIASLDISISGSAHYCIHNEWVNRLHSFYSICINYHHSYIRTAEETPRKKDFEPHLAIVNHYHIIFHLAIIPIFPQ